ncbi:MAG: tRNA (adenosine(37)-N6)-threonylcarbamoyltransferase complex ATPase subunit type 1 TsaE [Blastocatellia bacterium]
MIEKKTASDNSTITTEHVTRSAEETFELARAMAEQLDHRTVFLLSGDLGAGKSVFAKGLAAGLEIDPADVTSPTFALINVHEGRLRLYHVDLYRLDEGACFELGLEEMLDEEKAVTVIEWAERLGYTPAGAIQIEILYASDTERRISVRHPG